MRHQLIRFVLVAGIMGSAQTSALAEGRPIVAAASDLQFVMADIERSFETSSGEKVQLTFGSSGNLARQIRSGAPIELFLSADEKLVDGLAKDGFTQDAGKLYAEGRLALLIPHGSALRADGTLEDLRAALAEGRVRRFAIANPEHAPYGQRAREVLTARGLWQAILPKLVYGENVTQAAQFATSGAADGGIVAWSLGLAPEIAGLGAAVSLPREWHQPLRQRMVLTRNSGPVARRFFEYLQGREARRLLDQRGFSLP